MRLPKSTRELLTDYEGLIISVQDYLEHQNIPLDKSRTISAYKAGPEAFPGNSLDDFLEADVPELIEEAVAWFELGLRTYIIDQTNKKRNEEFKQPWHVAVYETIADFWQFCTHGEIVVRVEPDQEAIANRYRSASMRELKEHMKTVADEYLLDYFRLQNEKEPCQEERVYKIEDLMGFYE